MNVGTFFASSGDGQVTSVTGAWATARGLASGALTANTLTPGLYTIGANDNDIKRNFFPFDTSSLGAGAIVTAGTFSFYATGSITNTGTSIMTFTISTQISGVTLGTGDYSQLTLNSPTEIASRFNYSSVTSEVYNDIALNAAGIAAINTTGYTKILERHARDVDNSELNGMNDSFSIQSSTGANKPKLVVAYTINRSGLQTKYW